MDHPRHPGPIMAQEERCSAARGKRRRGHVNLYLLGLLAAGIG
jgi:hypothetical protein